MKKTKILVLALIMTLVASTAFAGGLSSVFGGGKDKEEKAKELAGNLWYDTAADFSSLRKILFYPMKTSLDPDVWGKVDSAREAVAAEAILEYEAKRKSWQDPLFVSGEALELNESAQRAVQVAFLNVLPGTAPLFAVSRETVVTPVKVGENAETPTASGDMFAAFRKSGGPAELEALSGEEGAPPVEQRYNIHFPAALAEFASEAERGEAVQKASGAQAYLTWEFEGPYKTEKVATFTPGVRVLSMNKSILGILVDAIKAATLEAQYKEQYGVTLFLYGSCRCHLRDITGREILAFSVKAPIEFNTKQMGYAKLNEERIAAALTAALKKAMNGRPAPLAPRKAKTFQVGQVTLDYLPKEPTYPAETEIIRKALETTILENAASSEKLRAAEGDTGDYLVEAAVTDCTVVMESKIINDDSREYGIEGKFKTDLKASLRLVDSKTKAVAATYQGKASGRSESEAFGKLVKKFFKEADKAVK